MKNLLLLVAMLCLNISAFSEVISLSSGLPARSNQQDINYAPENEIESFINEDQVWVYENRRTIESNGNEYFIYRFNGTHDIEGKTYHKLYELHQDARNAEDLDLTFDFGTLQPAFYIRQNGNSYYMLKANDENWITYGSADIESHIYNFKPEVSEWQISTIMEGGNYPDGYNCMPLPFDSKGNPVKFFKVDGWEEITGQDGDMLNTQITDAFTASPEFGVIRNGLLANPGCNTMAEDGSTSYNLSFVMDLEGNYLFKASGYTSVDNPTRDRDGWKFIAGGNSIRLNAPQGVVDAIIHTADGRLAKRFTMNTNADADISDLAGGIYFITFRGKTGAATYKFVRF